jgi:hypothetical protein
MTLRWADARRWTKGDGRTAIRSCRATDRLTGLLYRELFDISSSSCGVDESVGSELLSSSLQACRRTSRGQS